MKSSSSNNNNWNEQWAKKAKNKKTCYTLWLHCINLSLFFSFSWHPDIPDYVVEFGEVCLVSHWICNKKSLWRRKKQFLHLITCDRISRLLLKSFVLGSANFQMEWKRHFLGELKRNTYCPFHDLSWPCSCLKSFILGKRKWNFSFCNVMLWPIKIILVL